DQQTNHEGQNENHFFMNGPNISTRGYITNLIAHNRPWQPYVQSIQVNPYAGFGGFGGIGAMTNQADAGAAAWGTNSEGIPIYLNPWGNQFGEMSDGYLSGDTDINPECQLPGSDFFSLAQ